MTQLELPQIYDYIHPLARGKYDLKLTENIINDMKRYAACNQMICFHRNRNQKHPSNLRLLGGTDYESNYSSCRSDLSISGKISI